MANLNRTHQIIHRLKTLNDIHIRFVTNTTKESKDTLLERLHRIGFESINKSDIYSSLSAAVQYVHTNGLNPLYLLSEDAKTDFVNTNEPTDGVQDDKGNEDSVVIGLAPDKFNYDTLNKAFRYVTLMN